MSAIGEYVHLTANGYNQYGILRWGRSGGSPNFDFSNAQNSELNQLKSKLQTVQNTQDLEDTINAFFRRQQGGTSTNVDEEIKAAVLQQMKQNFKDKLGNINWNTGNVEKTEYLKQTSIGKLRQLGKDAEKARDMNKIKQKVKQLESIRDTLAQNIKEGDLQKSTELTPLLEQLKTEFNSLEQELESAPGSKDILMKSPSFMDKQRDLIKFMNQIITDYAALPAYALQKGEVFEYLVPYIIGVAQDKAIIDITENIENLKVGKEPTETIQFKPNAYALYSAKDQEYHEITFDQSILNIKDNAVQGKIDIYLQLNGQEIGASLKNYNLSSKNPMVHTLSDTTLFYFLQDLAPDFVNHYLNLNTTHLAGKGKINLTKRKESRQALRSIIAAKAFVGGSYERKVADLLIINDNSKGEVKIYSMRKLIDAISEADQKSNTLISVQLIQNNKKHPIMSQNLFNNKSVNDQDKTGTMRISKLINSLHSVKIKASVNNSWLLSQHEI